MAGCTPIVGKKFGRTAPAGRPAAPSALGGNKCKTGIAQPHRHTLADLFAERFHRPCRCRLFWTDEASGMPRCHPAQVAVLLALSVRNGQLAETWCPIVGRVCHKTGQLSIKERVGAADSVAPRSLGFVEGCVRYGNQSIRSRQGHRRTPLRRTWPRKSSGRMRLAASSLATCRRHLSPS